MPGITPACRGLCGGSGRVGLTAGRVPWRCPLPSREDGCTTWRGRDGHGSDVVLGRRTHRNRGGWTSASASCSGRRSTPALVTQVRLDDSPEDRAETPGQALPQTEVIIVIGVPDEAWGEAVAAYVRPVPGQPAPSPGGAAGLLPGAPGAVQDATALGVRGRLPDDALRQDPEVHEFGRHTVITGRPIMSSR
jgi:hypothetical protein